MNNLSDKLRKELDNALQDFECKQRQADIAKEKADDARRKYRAALAHEELQRIAESDTDE